MKSKIANGSYRVGDFYFSQRSAMPKGILINVCGLGRNPPWLLAKQSAKGN